MRAPGSPAPQEREKRREGLDGPGLYLTFAAALAAAGLGALGASVLRQSVIVGYLLAGMAIGPYTPGFVADVGVVQEMADIGVVLLMFVIGLQLSFRDIQQVRWAAVGGGIVQVAVTIAAGLAAGMILGLDWLPALFVGAVVSNSSSTVLAKVLSERGEADTLHARLALAWSTVQDFGTVVLVVVLTVLAEEAGTARLGADLARAVGLAVLYLLLVIPAGLVLLPRFLDLVARLGSPEVFTLAAAVVALGISLLAQGFGVSIALGAFVGGVLVNRSDLSHEVLGQLNPLRDIFAGVFFVSVGMLIDPRVVVQEPVLLAAVVLLIVVAKGWLSAVLARAFGMPARTAVLAGGLLAQSGEFSFLLARLGTATGALESAVFGVLLAGAAVSVAGSPLVMRFGERIARRLERGELEAAGETVRVAARGHAVVVGYGRVGSVVDETLRQAGIDPVVIEQAAAVVRELRSAGRMVVRGNAANRAVLEAAGVADARLLVCAVPDPVVTRRVVTLARSMNPRLRIVVRTHSFAERRFLEAHGADLAVLGELEIALELARFALHEFAVPEAAAEDLIEGQRRELT